MTDRSMSDRWMTVRADLADAHDEARGALSSAGATWNGRQRAELTQTALIALKAMTPLAPWVAPSQVDGALAHGSAAPARAHDIVYRVARHAGTLTEAWYLDAVAAVGELAYIELVSLTSHVAALWSFRRAAGLAPLDLGEPHEDAPTENVAGVLERASLNWVPVAAPADKRAAVVQAFSALPDELTRTWRLAAAQYMADEEMVHPVWTRGRLSRAQMELLAMTVSQSRECFY